MTSYKHNQIQQSRQTALYRIIIRRQSPVYNIQFLHSVLIAATYIQTMQNVILHISPLIISTCSAVTNRLAWDNDNMPLHSVFSWLLLKEQKPHSYLQLQLACFCIGNEILDFKEFWFRSLLFLKYDWRLNLDNGPFRSSPLWTGMVYSPYVSSSGIWWYLLDASWKCGCESIVCHKRPPGRPEFRFPGLNILMLNLAAVQLNKIDFNGKFALWQGGGA